MARQIRSPSLSSPTARSKLARRKKPFTFALAPGIWLAYRANIGAGVWLLKDKTGLRKFALADDFEPANGQSVMSYTQAIEEARTKARLGEGSTKKPILVSEAIDDFEKDLIARGANKTNATALRFNLQGLKLLEKAVADTVEKDFRDWRNGMVTGGLKPGSADRMGRMLKAALNLAARGDKRIRNAAEWRKALSRLKGSNKARDNVILGDATVKALVRELYIENSHVGLWGDLLSETGARESQCVKLCVADLQDDRSAPRLMLPCSLKGKNREAESRPVPISVRMALALRAVSAGRRQEEPLIDPVNKLAVKFKPVVKRLGLPPKIGPYSLRHSSIVRMLLKGVPIRVCASHHDSSVGEIERTYSKYISDVSDDLTRATLLNMDAPEANSGDNVVKIGARA